MTNLDTLTTVPKASKNSRERVLSFRVDFDTLDTLKRAARARNTTVSEYLRAGLSANK
jgi:uncharacterized protein (DUF1778 family)